LRQQEKDLDFAIKQDTVGQRLQALAREIEQCQQTVALKNRAATYNDLAHRLGLGEYSDRDTFTLPGAKATI
jgi:hypothetical protein